LPLIGTVMHDFSNIIFK